MTTETKPAPLVAIRRDDAAMLLTVADLYAPREYGTGALPSDIAPVAARVREAVGNGDDELAKLREGGTLIARTLDRLARTMEAARIEMQQSGPEKAMQWILGASEWPEDDGQGLAWDGKETARAWFDRVMAAEEAAP